jgi:hypothetical protein
MELIAEEVELGRKQSAEDIAAGSPRLFWGTRGAWGKFLTQLMAERFAVTVEHISDITTHAESSFRSGYNDFTREYIDQQNGSGSYQSVMDEVHRFRNEYYRQISAGRTNQQ